MKNLNLQARGETLKEIGKGLFNFANLSAVIIFFKAYMDDTTIYNYNYLFIGFAFWLFWYIFGARLIYLGEFRIKQGDKNES